MEVFREGHLYALDGFEVKDNKQTIQFIEKEPTDTAGELKTVYDGTTNEEVLSMLINRMSYLQGKFPCKENAIVITNLEESLMWLNKRTEERKSRNVEGKHIV